MIYLDNLFRVNKKTTNYYSFNYCSFFYKGVLQPILP